MNPPDGECLAHPESRLTTPRRSVFFDRVREAITELVTVLALGCIAAPYVVGLCGILRWLWRHLP